MARQYILGGFPVPIFVNETVTQQYILPVVYVNDTTAAASTAVVGQNLDFPNPRSPVRAISLLTWTESLKQNLAGQDTFFTGAGRGPVYDYQNPRGPIPAISLRTWIDQLKTTLSGNDQFFGLAGNPQRDWPNPRGPVPLLQAWTDSYKLALNGVPIPFVWNDWPNPRGRLPLLQDWTATLPINLAGQDTFFGLAGNPQHDWPNPRGTAPLLQGWTDSYRLALNGVPIPFVWQDWPNPRGRTPLVQDWTAPLQVNLSGQDQFFGLAGNPQHDWPNPRGSAPLLQTWTDPYKFTLNAVPVPFTQGDWPNPAGPIYAIALRTWVDPFKGAGTDTFFGLAGNPQRDWPNPTRAVVGLIPGIPPSTFYTSIPAPPPPPPPVDASVPGPADGEDDEPYADVARRKWLEWSRTRKRRARVEAAPPEPQLPPPLPPPTPRVAKRQLQNHDLLARNLERMRAGVLPGVLAPVATDNAPLVRDAVAKVVSEMQKIADDDDDDVVSFLLDDDL